MNTDRIFVREYLESLTEKGELNVIFPFLLEAMNFKILTKPSENLGLKEYGKDVVAVGKDKNGKEKKFYFELKGGEDRDISERTLNGQDGIISSIHDASLVDYNALFPEFKHLPLEIVIVHNGIVKGNAINLLSGFLTKIRSLCPEIEYSTWDIDALSHLFTEHLFGPYLLSEDSTRKNLNRVLINLDSVQDVSIAFKDLIREILFKNEWSNNRGKIPRPWMLKFETLKLIGFIIYRESASNNNLGIAERHLRYIIIDFWFWILKNKQENRTQIRKCFVEVYNLYTHVLTEFGERTLPIALRHEGLHYPNGSAYEQVGYTLRTHDYISLIIYGLNTSKDADDENALNLIIKLIDQNSVSKRALLDIHSLSILDTVLFFKKFKRDDLARKHIREVFGYIQFSKETYGRMPDASNNAQNVIKLFATGEKPPYYIDSTSLLLGLLIELTVIFNMPDDFNRMRDFAIEHSIDLAAFVPHHGESSKSKHLIKDLNNDLEEQLFSKSFDDGYQSDIGLYSDIREKISFDEFKERLQICKNEFTYDYRTDKVGFGLLRSLSHFQFKTPYFPDKWRVHIAII